MKRTTSFLAASTFFGAATIALTATAQQVAPSSPPTPTPTGTGTATTPATPTTPQPTPATPTTSGSPTMTSTTTLTAGDTTSDTTAGTSAIEPREVDTVTVNRSLRPNRPLLITGGLILVGTYVPTAVIADTSGRTVEDSNLLIPVIGPWMNLADRRCNGCDNETRNVALVIGSGILQGIGAGMTIMSFFVPEKVAAATIQAGPVKLQVAPSQVGRTGMGLGTVGVF